MKKFILLLLVCLSVTSIGLTRVHGYTPPVGPVDEIRGNFEAEIKWSHRDENGDMQTTNHTVHGYTLAGCQFAVNQFSNIQIITGCHQVF